MSIPQQGSGFLFSMTTYKYLTNSEISNFEVILEDVPDAEVRTFLEKVQYVATGGGYVYQQLVIATATSYI